MENMVKFHESHESVVHIKSLGQAGDFTFSKVSKYEILKRLKNINGKRATGYDTIPPKLLKLGAD